MCPSPNEDRDAALADLKTKWPDLDPLDRAQRIREIKATGTSMRALAKSVGCSESTLRHLLKAAEAQASDQVHARKGNISTRELVRRSKKAEAQQKAKDREIADRKRTEEAQKGAEAICDWLREKAIGSAHGENIIDEARGILARSEQDGTLPKATPPVPGTPLKAIIEPLRPSKSVNPDTESVSWYADWLARWAFFAFPDDIVRDRALNIALDSEIKKR